MLDFLGIGAQKAGTTWLYENLQKHPQIKFPAGKEIHFWNSHYANGVDWYKSLFPGGDSKIKKGEITPAYAILPPEKIKEAHENFPNIPLIYILRDPVMRAWSSALMALERAEMKITEASDQWFIDHFNSSGSLRRSDYATCIGNWLRFYPKRQLLLIDFRQIKTDPAGLLKKCAEHIGVDGGLFPHTEKNDLNKKIHATAGHPIRPSLVPALEKLHAENRKFYESLF